MSNELQACRCSPDSTDAIRIEHIWSKGGFTIHAMYCLNCQHVVAVRSYAWDYKGRLEDCYKAWNKEMEDLNADPH